MIRNLGFRYKIPLRGSLLIAITAIIITSSLLYGVYHDLKRDALQNADRMSRLLVHTLTPLLLHDDVWRTYEVIKSPIQIPNNEKLHDIDEILLLTPRQQVYVSTNPKKYPALSDLAQINPNLGELKSIISQFRETAPKAVELPNSDKFYVISNIISDGVLLGTLVLGYSNSMFMPHFYGIVWQSIITTLLVAAAILPLTWFWGWRMAEPLTQLASSMSRVSSTSTFPDPDDFSLYESKDEIGQIGVAFKRMLGELKEKENLEKQILVSERLAAIGRLTAGIAHEINNPLGGMLNAINTEKKHGNSDPQTRKTISLLERGLLQIKDIIAALLVEAKFQSHPLSVQDIEDTRTLVQADAHKISTQIIWHNDIKESQPIPSTLVRQVLINLLLNAIQASHENGLVHCHIFRESDNLVFTVSNDGRHITTDQMGYLFEPLASGRDSGNGLGLWIVYQIVSQLKGEITMQSEPGETIFTVTLPLGVQA